MTLTKRVIPCLDVAKGRVVKGLNFKSIKFVDKVFVYETEKDLYNWLNKQMGGAMTDPTKVLTDPKGVFGNLLPMLGIGSSALIIPSIFRGIKNA